MKEFMELFKISSIFMIFSCGSSAMVALGMWLMIDELQTILGILALLSIIPMLSVAAMLLLRVMRIS